MKSLYLNKDGDLEFDGLNSFKMVEGDDEVRQRLRIAILTNMGEWFLDTSLGVPWMDMLGKRNNQDEIKQAILKELKKDDDVQSIETIDIVFDDHERTLNISFNGTLINGTKINEEVTL